MSSQVFNAALPRLREDDVLVEEGAAARLPEHRPGLTEEQRRAADAYLELLDSDPYSPPTESPVDPEVLSLLAEEGSVVKVSENVVFSASAYRGMVDRISTHLGEQGKITVADVRDLFGTSRKYAIALMDHLDQQRLTRRVGDHRVLR